MPHQVMVSLLFAGEIMGPETVLLTARYLLKGGCEDLRERVRQLLSGMRVYLAAWKTEKKFSAFIGPWNLTQRGHHILVAAPR